MSSTPSGGRPLRALIVGLGSIGQRHARNLRTLLGADVDLIAYRARGLTHVLGERSVESRSESVSERLSIREFTDLDAALAEKPDVGFICNPTRLHVETALRLADAGCHLFIEKPLADDFAGVEDLRSAVERHGLIAMVGCQLRFHPLLRRTHDLLADDAIGRLTSVRIAVGEYLPSWHPYEDYRTSYAARRDLGGGVILTLIHELDYAYWLFGAPRRLFAVGGQLSELELDVEDTASILMDCGDRDRSLPVHVQMDFLQRPPTRRCEIVGSTGRIEIDLLSSTLDRYDHEGARVEHVEHAIRERNQLFLAELGHFLDCVRDRSIPAVTLDDGIATLRIALAARESLASGTMKELR